MAFIMNTRINVVGEIENRSVDTLIAKYLFRIGLRITYLSLVLASVWCISAKIYTYSSDFTIEKENSNEKSKLPPLTKLLNYYDYKLLPTF